MSLDMNVIIKLVLLHSINSIGFTLPYDYVCFVQFAKKCNGNSNQVCDLVLHLSENNL